MANISVTNSLTSNTATSDITLVGTNFTDLVNGLTDGTKDISISNGSFAGVVKAANGTVALPSLSFTNDLDCGVYRIGANNLGIAVNGVKQVDIATNGITFPNQSGFSATRATAQNVANNASARVQYNTEQFDTNSEYDSTGTIGTFTATNAGVYYAAWSIVSASVAWDVGEYWASSLVRNSGGVGLEFFTNQWTCKVAVTLSACSTGSAIIKLDASDVVAIYIKHTQGAAVDTLNNAIYNYFMMVRIA